MKRGYEAHILGEAPHSFPDPVQALQELKVCFLQPARALCLCLS